MTCEQRRYWTTVRPYETPLVPWLLWLRLSGMFLLVVGVPCLLAWLCHW